MSLHRIFAGQVAALALSGAALTAQAAPDPSPAPAIPTTKYTTDPLLPLPVTGGLAVAFLGVCGYGMARHSRQGAMIGAGAVVLTALVNPVVLRETRKPVPSEVRIVVDRSPSQNLGARTAQTDAALTNLKHQLEATPGINVKIVDPAAAGAGHDGTPLFAAIESAIMEVPCARMGMTVVLTDGAVHDAKAKAPCDAPVHVLVTGAEDEKDRRIEILNPTGSGIVGAEQKIAFIVHDGGAMPPGPVTVKASIDDRTLPDLRVVPGQRSEITVTPGHEGSNFISLSTAVIDGELTAQNNRGVAEINARQKPLNILLMSGTPGPGMRMLTRLIKSDPNATVTPLAAIGNPGGLDPTPENEKNLMRFPTDDVLSPQSLDKTDVVIMDHFGDTGVLIPSHFENLAAWVKRGGALMVLAGPESIGKYTLYTTTPLAPLLPARPTGTISQAPYRAAIAPAGERHPVTRDLFHAPPGRWYSLIDSEVVSGDLLMTGSDKKPLLVLAHQEKGRVVSLLSDQVYLWNNGHDGGGPHQEMMGRIVRWLMKDPDMAEEALRVTREGEALAVTQQTMADRPAAMTMETPSGKKSALSPQKDKPGLWTARVQPEELGLYSVTRGGEHPARAFLNVGPPNPQELFNALSNTEILRPVAEASGGSLRRIGAAAPQIRVQRSGTAMNGTDWIGLRQTEVSILEDTRREPAVPFAPYSYLLATLAFTAAAAMRRGNIKPNGLWQQLRKPEGP